MMSNVKTKPAKKLTKSTTDSLINYGIVIVLYIIMMIMQATGNLSSSMVLLVEKCQPLESTPKLMMFTTFLIISPNASVTIAR